MNHFFHEINGVIYRYSDGMFVTEDHYHPDLKLQEMRNTIETQLADIPLLEKRLKLALAEVNRIINE